MTCPARVFGEDGSQSHPARRRPSARSASPASGPDGPGPEPGRLFQELRLQSSVLRRSLVSTCRGVSSGKKTSRNRCVAYQRSSPPGPAGPLASGLTTGPSGRDRFGRAEPIASTSLLPDLHPAVPDPVVMKPRLRDVVTCHRGTADSVWRRLSATMSFRSDRRRSTCPLMDTWARRGRRRQGETGCTLPARFGCCWPLPPLEMFHPGVARGGVPRRYQRRQGSAGASMSSTASSRGTSAPSCSMCCSSAPSATSRSTSSVSAPATAISYGAVRFSSQCLRW